MNCHRLEGKALCMILALAMLMPAIPASRGFRPRKLC